MKKIIKENQHPKTKKSEQKLEYWNPKNILETGATYYFAYGQRGNGKTTAIMKYMLQEYIDSGYQRQGAIIRRWLDDFKGFNGPQMCDFINSQNWIEKWTKGRFNIVLYKSRMWYLANIQDGDVIESDSQPCMFGFAITAQEHYKSTQFPNVCNIMFDECISSDFYLPDEFVQYMNLLSTIIRNREGVKIFMLGNSISKFCPYFKEMGLNKVKTQKQGTIDVYSYGDSGLKVAVEYCKTLKKSKEQNKYFAFDNPKLDMITTGGWQIANYPRLPVYYTPNEVKFKFYISFYDDLFQCNIIKSKELKSSFIFIAPKTRNIYDKKALIFDILPRPEKNYRRRITHPTDKIGKIIYKYFVDEKVFYANNETGDIIHNYLNWCKKESY